MTRRHLHTAYGDEIRKVAETDPERAAEMKMESQGYRDEVMGKLDWDEDPYDQEAYNGREEEPEDE